MKFSVIFLLPLGKNWWSWFSYYSLLWSPIWWLGQYDLHCLFFQVFWKLISWSNKVIFGFSQVKSRLLLLSVIFSCLPFTSISVKPCLMRVESWGRYSMAEVFVGHFTQKLGLATFLVWNFYLLTRGKKRTICLLASHRVLVTWEM